MSQLARILATLYPERDEVHFFLREVRLDPNEIDLDGNAVLRWGRVLEEAAKHGRVEAIVKKASQEYPRRADALAASAARYQPIAFPDIDQPRWMPGASATLPSYRTLIDDYFPRFHYFLTTLSPLTFPADRGGILDHLRDQRASIKKDFYEKTYLPLTARSLKSGNPYEREIDRDPFVSPIHQVIRSIMGESHGGDSANAQIAAASRQSRVVRNVLRHLEHTRAPLILLGEPGSGKTMTLQQVALQLTIRETSRVYPKIPLFIRLGEFYVEGKADRHAVWDYVQGSAPEEIRDQLDTLERQGRLVFLFDGMDEMSRDRYGEHTEALSTFADWTSSKTLFSCRITDFSPRFMHQRLVLMPFDRGQIAQYLKEYVAIFPVVIDQESWSLKSLGRHLSEGDLTIEANNPFALWLLCLYIQDKAAWPESRVEMLGYYNERNYQRKNEELEDNDEAPLPYAEVTFKAWSRFAYTITSRNRGPAIPVALLTQGHEESEIQDWINAGKRCGVLAESREIHAEHLVRFKHHRFQEYFAARYIHEEQPKVDWLQRFDAPRWQEVLLNLILMGDVGGALPTFTESMTSLTKACEDEIAPIKEENLKIREENEKDSSSEKKKEKEIILSEQDEVVLADRVEVASRIMQQIGGGALTVRQDLMPPFRDAVSLLADHGNPITQVKMMRACQNVPEMDFIEALRTPLNSKVNWVRDQALLLVASSRRGARAIGTDIATEIGYDLATGNFLKRLLAYLQAAKTSRKKSDYYSVFAGAVCYIFQLAIYLVGASGLYYGVWKLGDLRMLGLYDFRSLGNPVSLWLFVAMTLLTLGFALKIAPPQTGQLVLSSALTYVLLVPVLVDLWGGSLLPIVGLFLKILFLGFLVIHGVALLISIPVHIVSLGALLVLTAALRRHQRGLRGFFVSAWKTEGYWLFSIGFAALYALTWALGLNADLVSGLLGQQALENESDIPIFNGMELLAKLVVLLFFLYGVGFIVFNIVSGLVSLIREAPRHQLFSAFLFVSMVITIAAILVEFLFLGWFLSLTLAAFSVAVCGVAIYLLVHSRIRELVMTISGLVMAGGLAWALYLLGQGLSGVWLKHEAAITLIIVAAGIAVVALCFLGAVWTIWQDGDKGLVFILAGVGLGLAVYTGLEKVDFSGLFLSVPDFENADILMARIVAVLLAIMVLLLFFVAVRSIFKGLRLSFYGRRHYPPGILTRSLWLDEMRDASPRIQKNLLSRTDHQSLSLNAEEFLDVLREARSLIKEEPALSTYWEKRNRLEEALRQERE